MGNGILKVSNLRKTYYYLKKNGIKNAYYAALERVIRERKQDYCYVAPSREELEKQKETGKNYPYRFSILVPAYETNEVYLREMIDSVRGQSYDKWELIVADASKSDRVKAVMDTYTDARICYLKLTQNLGISENTNAALEKAQGDYIGLLDHDDVLTPDALYEMASSIHQSENNGKQAWMLYSDEDKGNGDLTCFYEPHVKPPLNVDLLLSNNYICHFLVMKSELMKELGFRREYDGAQDFDLVLRAVGKLIYEGEKDRSRILHIPKVLYHWRCHTSSTAENPESKRYAYEAGKGALEDFMKVRGWKGTVSHTKHLGFYQIEYEKDIFAQRNEVGVIGGRVLDRRGRITGGIYDEDGLCPYNGLHKNFSGYMHRATLRQEAYGVDVRCMKVREELWGVYEEVFGRPYDDAAGGISEGISHGKIDGIPYGMGMDGAPSHAEVIEQSMEFCRRAREAGYMVVWTPQL